MFKGGLGDLLQQASRMKEEVQRIQAEMGKRTVERTSGGGMVKVTANGRQEIVAIAIDPELLKLGDREMLQDLVRAATNEAVKASQEMVGEEMKKLTGGLGMLSSFFKGMGG